MRKKKVLSKFKILCWAAFIATPGHVQPSSHGLDTPNMQHDTFSCLPIFYPFLKEHLNSNFFYVRPSQNSLFDKFLYNYYLDNACHLLTISCLVCATLNSSADLKTFWQLGKCLIYLNVCFTASTVFLNKWLIDSYEAADVYIWFLDSPTTFET